jgi:hypothetical protein
MPDLELSQAELMAIRALKKVARTFPPTLWIFTTGSGDTYIMRKKAHGEIAFKDDGYPDRDYIVDNLHGIHIDGGEF